ncbi:MAG: radical SAM protein [Thermoanaerobaculia bacterium]
MALTSSATAELSRGGARPLTLADYATTSGITLRLAEDVWVNAPIEEHNGNFIKSPPHVLEFGEAGFFIRSGEEQFPAWPLPVPDYHNLRNFSEENYTDYAVTHADRVRISPISGCDMVCRFCDVPYEFRYRRRRIDGLIESVRKAIDDQALPARHILISGGVPREEDISYLRTVYRSVAEMFSEHVDIMMVPIPNLLDLQALYSRGIHGLSINIELFNRERAQSLMKQKFDLGLDYYLDFIEKAVKIFGPGRVRSLLIVGLEPPHDTLRAVQCLAERGCDPVLSPFRPDPSTPMKNHPAPSAELLEHVYVEAQEIVSRYQVKLGPRCIPCQHNTLAYPDGSEGYYHS